MKKAAVIALILGILMIITSVVLPILTIISSAEEANNAAVGIIGGADGPTAILVTSEIFFGLPAVILFLGIALVCASVVTFIVYKKKKK